MFNADLQQQNQREPHLSSNYSCPLLLIYSDYRGNIECKSQQVVTAAFALRFDHKQPVPYCYRWMISTYSNFITHCNLVYDKVQLCYEKKKRRRHFHWPDIIISLASVTHIFFGFYYKLREVM